MKKFIVFTVALVFSALSYATESLPAPHAEDLTPIDKIVAVVNTDIITQAELNKAVFSAKQQFQQHNMPLPNPKELQTKILDGLIYQKLQLQIAKQNNITVSDKQVDEAIDNIAKQNNLTIDQLKQKIAEQHLDFATFKSQIKEQLVISTLQHEALNNKIDLNEKKLEAFKKQYEHDNATVEYHVVDYLIPLSDDASAAQKENAKQRALQLSKQLQKSNSVADNGVLTNDLGWRPATDLPDVFATVVVKMADNTASQPLLAGNGYHVLKLLASKQKGNDINDDQARQLLLQQESQKQLKKWLESVRGNAYVKIYD